MGITITEYTDAMVAEVRRFNDRLKAGGVQSRFPTSHVPKWLPKMPGRKIFQEFHVALAEDSSVRGAYVLKHQPFRIGGKSVTVGDFSLPISEGVFDRAYSQIGVQLLLDAQRKQPLLYGLGMGSYDEPLARLLAAAGWNMFSVPFFFRIVHPFRFLRDTVYLRQSMVKRGLLDILAFTGLGWIAVKGLYALCHRGFALPDSITTETVEEFGDWADELWETCQDQYGMSAVRDCETLRILYPKEKEKFIRLRVAENRKTIGWAVLLNTKLSGHKQFGDMRLGSIVDCFSSAADARLVIRCARALLEERGVDMMVSNQSHAAWCKAFDAAGFMRGPSNFIFASSKKLTKFLEESGAKHDDIHMNRGDGDGPINL